MLDISRSRGTRGRPAAAAVAGIVLAGLLGPPALAVPVDGAWVETDLVSVAAGGGTTANEVSTLNGSDMTPDGAFVVFVSHATDLTNVADDNQAEDVFLWERATREVTAISTTANGSTMADNTSNRPRISDDGAFVVFESRATDLTDDVDTNDDDDLFVWERETGTMRLVSTSRGGGATGNDASQDATLSADGRHVAFTSWATNLTTEDDTARSPDVFLWDRTTGSTELITRTPQEAAGHGAAPSISADGRFLAFTSGAVLTSATDTNELTDVHLYDRERDRTRLVSQNHDRTDTGDGLSNRPVISADGSTVVYVSRASNLTTHADANATPPVESVDDTSDDVYAWDRSSGATRLISHTPDRDRTGDEASLHPLPSADGRVVAFASWAGDLTSDVDTNERPDVFLWRRATDEVRLASRTGDGTAAGAQIGDLEPRFALSGNGRFVAYTTDASTVTDDPDDNNIEDVYRWNRSTGESALVSTDPSGAAAGEPNQSSGSRTLAISRSGAHVLFVSEAQGVTTHTDGNGDDDVFLARVLDDACHAGEVPDAGFGDTGDTVHAAAIDCLAWWGITHGRTAGRYDPAADVTRGEMATFVARLLEAAGTAMPDDPPDRFDDDETSVHERAIDQVAALGLVEGRTEATYAPDDAVTRAEMATYLVGVHEEATGEVLDASADHFTDDEESVHEPAINQIAEAGFTRGVTFTIYEPARVVWRDEMASYLTRLLDPLVIRGMAAAP